MTQQEQYEVFDRIYEEGDEREEGRKKRKKQG